MNNFTLRLATVKDLPILYEFEQGIIEAERPFDPTLKTEHFNYYDIKELILSSTSDVVVAVCNNKIVGSGYVRIENSKPYLKHNQHAYLGFMFVKPEYRGVGIVQSIIEHFKDWTRSKNLSELRLGVYSKNDRAIKEYEKVGFENHLIEMRMQIK